MKLLKQKKSLTNDMPIIVKIVSYAGTTAFSLICLIPLIICIVSSFTDETSLAVNGYRLWPKEISFDSYKYIFTNGSQIWRAYGVTIVVLVVGVFSGLLIMSLFAYAVTRPKFPWKNQFAFFSYFTMLFNGGMVASYIINTTVYQLRDTIWILIISGCVSAYNILLMRNYMKTNIPNEIMESVDIDGGGELVKFFKFALPLSTPMLSTIALFLAVQYWNNWNTSLLYIVSRNDLAPIQLVLKRIENNIEYLANAESTLSGHDFSEQQKTVPSESFKMALVTMTALPMIILYPLFQKFFVKGITVGAVKG